MRPSHKTQCNSKKINLSSRGASYRFQVLNKFKAFNTNFPLQLLGEIQICSVSSKLRIQEPHFAPKSSNLLSTSLCKFIKELFLTDSAIYSKEIKSRCICKIFNSFEFNKFGLIKLYEILLLAILR